VNGDSIWTSQTNNAVYSIAKCPENMLLVSCGYRGSVHTPGGSIIMKHNECMAINIYNGLEDNIEAVARCCPFPPGTEIVKRDGQISEKSETKCIEEKKEILIGCGVSSTDGNILGSFIGNNNNPKESNQLTTTRNQKCNGRGYNSSCVNTNVECVRYDTTKYELKCESLTKITNEPLKCPGGYFLTSCNALSDGILNSKPPFPPKTTFDHNYIDNNNECHSQQDNRRPMYTQIVCCQMTETVIEGDTALSDKFYYDFYKNNYGNYGNLYTPKRHIIFILLISLIFILSIIIFMLKYSNKKDKVKSYISVRNDNYSSQDSTDCE